MTQFMGNQRPRSSAEIDAVIERAPANLPAFQRAAACVDLADRPPMGDWLARFSAGTDRKTARRACVVPSSLREPA